MSGQHHAGKISVAGRPSAQRGRDGSFGLDKARGLRGFVLPSLICLKGLNLLRPSVAFTTPWLGSLVLSLCLTRCLNKLARVPLPAAFDLFERPLSPPPPKQCQREMRNLRPNFHNEDRVAQTGLVCGLS